MNAMTFAAIAVGGAVWLALWVGIMFALGFAAASNQFFRLLLHVRPYSEITPVVVFAATAWAGISVGWWMIG